MSQIQEKTRALADLHARLAACRRCLDAGYDIFPRAIHSGGIGARMMLIGQAPGITEKEAGRPFNAGSGKRLFQWLAEAGIEENWFRSTQYMTAVTKCYPGRVPAAKNTSRSSGDRVPSIAEQRLCRPYLNEEIALINPTLILAVGRLAIGLFYPPGQNLEEIIGTCKQVDERWVVPLPHPSGASRWHQIPANRQLIQQAVGIISQQRKELSK
jgi:uracil-DNA glycosylase